MAGNTFGALFRVTTFGESHGAALGAVIDGSPAGLPLTEEDIRPLMDRRRPGVRKHTSARNEADRVEILSGVFEGKTTGTPIALLVRNEDQRSRDYSDLADVFRPGHADFTFTEKYGIRDYRGGGRSSGRETAARVAAGAVAMKLLSRLGITIESEILSIGGIPLESGPEDASGRAQALLDEAAAAGDSLGGVVECRVRNLPAGLGEPVFDKLDADLAKALFSVGAVKGVETGEGFRASELRGSENNDPFTTEDGRVRTLSNHAGGVLGGMSSGEELVIRASVKPTPSVACPQTTVNAAGEPVALSIRGRHDTCIVPRVTVVIEAMTALVLADHLLRNMSARLDTVLNAYGREPNNAKTASTDGQPED